MSLMLPARATRARLIDLVPQMWDALEGRPGSLKLEPVRSAVIVVIDGLGARNLSAAGGHARYLGSRRDRRAVAETVFPSTTAAALTSLMTGTEPGRHGIVGYRTLVPERDILSNQLNGWEEDGLDPLTWQRATPLFETASGEGRPGFVVSREDYRDSGFTRAMLRGAQFHSAKAFDERLEIARDLAVRHPGSLTYVYTAELDSAGHRHGIRSDRWLRTLEAVDAAVSVFAERLPGSVGALVTADHGMVDVPARAHVLLSDGDPRLEGVRHVGGEPRMLHLYVDERADPAGVRDRWLGLEHARSWVMSRREAIDAGLFGDVDDAVAPRIGDILVAARSRIAYYDDRLADKRAQAMVGQHGSLTDQERVVPLIRLGSFAD